MFVRTKVRTTEYLNNQTVLHLMTHNHCTFFRSLAAALALLLITSTGRAQDKEQAPADEMAPAKKPAANKAAVAPKADEKAAPPATYEEPNPVIETILESNPKTPAELAQGIASLVQLDRPELAKPWIQKLLDARVDADTAADLVRRFGAATFLRWAGNPKLNPEARKLADLLLSTVAVAARDPKRLAARVKQLQAPLADVRLAAMIALREGGTYSIPPLWAALADPAMSSGRALAQQAIVDLGQEAVPPLVAALSAKEPALKIRAIELLSAIGGREATTYLLAPALAADSPADVRKAAGEALKQLLGGVPTRADAIKLLTNEARVANDGKRVLLRDYGDNVSIWRWDSTSRQLVREVYPPKRALAFVAARLAGDLLALEPDAIDARRLYLISLLDSAVYRAGLDGALPTGPGSELQQAGQLGAEAVNDALAQALATGHTAAAKGAARVLQDVGDASLLRADQGRFAPLVEALRSGDSRLRQAAAAAIMSFKPKSAFGGSSYLTDAVIDLAKATGRPRVVIGYPTVARAQALAGLANSEGWESQTASFGRDVLLAATESNDTELVLVSGRIDRPGVYDLVQQLQHDPHTAQAPICVLGELEDLAGLERLFEGFVGTRVCRAAAGNAGRDETSIRPRGGTGR